MPEEESGLPFVSSLGLSITDACPITCSHCIVNAGPHRKGRMKIEELYSWMQQASAYRNGYITSVVITGGEPFYDLPLLRDVLACALSWRLVPIVMTNAFWAKTLQATQDELRSLPHISMLNVSTDSYHQRFIPLRYAANALLAAKSLGIKYSAAVCVETEHDPASQRTISELRNLIPDCSILSAGICPAGRARKLRDGRLELTKMYPPWPCTDADCPTVFPDGRLIACMAMVQQLPNAHPLLLGNLRESSLQELLEQAERNTALHILRVWGPAHLFEMLERAGARDLLPKTYTKHCCCDLCYALARDSRLLGILLELIKDTALSKKVAYARLFYLHEPVVPELQNQFAGLKSISEGGQHGTEL
jgi:organic radical activating enzyme